MVKKIQGKGNSASVNHLKNNNDNITSKKDIANTLADSFSKPRDFLPALSVAPGLNSHWEHH